MYLRLIYVCIQLLILLLPFKAGLAYPGLWIELYYPDNYRFALWEWKPIENATVTGPENFFAESDNTIIPLPSPPIIGNTYRFNIIYQDGSKEIWDYKVTGFNSSFAHMMTPADGDEIYTTTPTFTWSEASGIDRYVLMVHGENGHLWTTSIPAGTTSCKYNYDGTAADSLQWEKSYSIFLHTFDSDGHQATTTSGFIISKPCAEIKSSHKYRMEFQYDTSIDNPQKIWLPIPRLWEGRGVKELKNIKITPTPTDRYYDPNGTGTEIAYWENSGEEIKKISIEFEVELSLIRHCLDENQTWPQYDTGTELYQKNTVSTPWVQSDHPEIVNTAQSIIGSEFNPYKQARLIFNWVNTEIQGSPLNQPPEPDGDALLVLHRRTAGCGGFANLFVALCRSVGIPARNIGVYTPPAGSGQIYFQYGLHCIDCPNPGFGSHVMSEFYLPEYGWVQCDTSQRGGIPQFGRISEERIFMSKGNDIDLGNNHSCSSDQGWNIINNANAWFHLPRIPCQTSSGMTLSIQRISNQIPSIQLLLFDD